MRDLLLTSTPEMMVLVALIRTVARMFSIGAFKFVQGSLTFKS